MAPIKTALCSFGMSGQVFHAPFIQLHAGFELYAVVERSKQIAATKYPGINSYPSIESMLEDKNVELLVVNTPNATHYEFAKLGLEAGKNVVVEKPFTLSVKEATELIQLAKKKNKKLTVYQNRRWDSDYKTVQDVVQKKLLGDIVEAEFHFDRYKPSLSPKLHKEAPGPGTGLLYDLGSHLIDQALHLFGTPQSIFADARIVRPVSKVEDYFDLILFYENLRIRLKGSYLVKESLPAYILHGTRGSFIKPRADVQETDLQAGRPLTDPAWGEEPAAGKGLLHIETNGKAEREFITSLTGNYMEFYDLLYTALSGNGPLPVTPEDALQVIRIIEAANESVANNKTVFL